MHTLLEHTDGLAAQLHRHWLPSLQPVLVEEHQRARLDARLLAEPNRRVALLVDEQGGDAHGTHAACPLPGYVARRPDHRHGRRRRDAALLECLPRPKDQGRRLRFLVDARLPRQDGHPLRSIPWVRLERRARRIAPAKLCAAMLWTASLTAPSAVLTHACDSCSCARLRMTCESPTNRTLLVHSSLAIARQTTPPCISRRLFEALACGPFPSAARPCLARAKRDWRGSPMWCAMANGPGLQYEYSYLHAVWRRYASWSAGVTAPMSLIPKLS
mmetsp:Transcript_35135/g.92251  ORF Transcript_35135/g.92251 Transcript_35135/m.92251 type:complete len:273 (+) Transcript_35135:1193-2011(+)